MKSIWRIVAHRKIFGAITLGLWALSACAPSVALTVKIALVAPFEGRYRAIGEEVIYAIRLAAREANARGGVAGYSIELMAYDDRGDPALAAEQARKIATDPQIMGVIGHWLNAPTLTAAPVYARAGIPFLATTAAPELDPAAFRLWLNAETYWAAAADSEHCPLPCDSLETLDWFYAQPAASVGPDLWGLNQFQRLTGAQAEGVAVVAPAPLPDDSSDPLFADRYRAISPGPQPGYYAVLAYDAATLLFAAIASDLTLNAAPTRPGVEAALTHTAYIGLSGPIAFDRNRDWDANPGWVYLWQAHSLVRQK